MGKFSIPFNLCNECCYNIHAMNVTICIAKYYIHAMNVAMEQVSVSQRVLVGKRGVGDQNIALSCSGVMEFSPWWQLGVESSAVGWGLKRGLISILSTCASFSLDCIQKAPSPTALQGGYFPFQTSLRGGRVKYSGERVDGVVFPALIAFDCGSNVRGSSACQVVCGASYYTIACLDQIFPRFSSCFFQWRDFLCFVNMDN